MGRYGSSLRRLPFSPPKPVGKDLKNRLFFQAGLSSFRAILVQIGVDLAENCGFQVLYKSYDQCA